MKARLYQSTTRPITFCLVSSTDHITAVTGATPTVVISKDGGAFASPSGAVTEIGNGWYKIAGNATDRNTLGELLVHATATGADPWDEKYVIVAFDPFDSLALGLSRLDLAVSNVAPAVATYVWNEDVSTYGSSTAGEYLTAAFDNSIDILAEVTAPGDGLTLGQFLALK